MLTTGELKAHAHMRRLRILDQIWKDYLQDMALHLVFRRHHDAVFRGGTCIWKVYRGDRFSEDIDLCAGSMPEGLDEYMVRELGLLGFSCSVERRKRTENMTFARFAITSPAHPRPVPLLVEVLESPECAARGVPATIYSPYPDIPPIPIRVPAPEDIALDKISAILGRDKPRDIHDLYILLKQGAGISMDDVRARVPGFDKSDFRKRMEGRRRDWKSLEPLLVVKLPSLEDEMRFIMACLEG